MSVNTVEQYVEEGSAETCADETVHSEINKEYAVYSFVDVKNKEMLNAKYILLDKSEIKTGGVVVLKKESEKPQYFTVQDVKDTVKCVELVPAKNAYGKIALLFALLGISWLVIDYIAGMVF